VTPCRINSPDTRAISDPVDQGLDVFRARYERIDRCVRARRLARQAAGTILLVT
jgi:hypothetical protein